MTTQTVQSLAVRQLPVVDRAVDALRAGEMVLLEEPGDLVSNAYLVARAQTITKEMVARMLSIAHGTPFVALPAHRCDALGLPRPSGPPRADRNFLVNIEAREGTTTGISAADRALTIRVAADPTTTSADIVVPGHIVPVRVEEGGVLTRAGAPEAAVDLMMFAGGPEGAALCQVLDDDGGPPSPHALESFAHEHGLPHVRSVDVLDQRLGREQLVDRVAEQQIETDAGAFQVLTYSDERSATPHFAILRGEVVPEIPTTLRVRVQQPLLDALGVGEDSQPRINQTLDSMAGEAHSVLLYLAPSEAVAVGSEDAATRFGDGLFAAKRRSHLVTQILRDLRVGAVDLGQRDELA